MKIIVTGGAGMIGANLCAKLIKQGHQVVALDNLWRGSVDNLRHACGDQMDRVELVVADLMHLSDWCEVLRDADCVYHLADVVAGIGYVFANEAQIFRRNLIINANVATACELMHVKRYVYVGTACSFPLELQTGVNAAPLREEQQFPAHPESAYGWSKLMGELDAGYMAKSSGIETCVLSLHNVYGTPCDYASDRAQVLPALSYRGLSLPKGGTLSVWGDGTQGRAFVHVSDVVTALHSALDKGAGKGVMQIGPDVCTSIGRVAELIREAVDNDIQISFDTTKPTGDLGRCADYSKAHRELGWEPKVDLGDGIKDMINWMRQQEAA